MARRRRILALATYPQSAAATRFRLTGLFPYLRARGWEVRFEPFIDDRFLSGFYKEGQQLRKAAYLATRSFERLILSLSVSKIDAVLIQREAALIGPPYAEFILSSLKQVPLIFDFDDALWELDSSRSKHPFAARALKDPNKCWHTIRRAAGVIAGSSYLAERALEVNSRVTVAPTVVASKEWTPLPGRLQGEVRKGKPLHIGWVGTHSTAHQLELVEPALRQLRAEGYDFEVHVVGAGSDFGLNTVEVQTRPWRLEDEIQEFQHIDIGLAPMQNGPVYEGKCGFKQLQYMAVGVPFVSSWVGGARDFVHHGENGLVALGSADWYHHLKALFDSQELRGKLSLNGRRCVEANYCAEAQGPRIAEFIEEVLSARA